LSDILRRESDLLQQKKQDAFQLERQHLELQRVTAALLDARKTEEAARIKEDFALATQSQLEAALRETKVKSVRLKHRLAAMGSNIQGGAKVQSWMDASGHSGSSSADLVDS